MSFYNYFSVCYFDYFEASDNGGILCNEECTNFKLFFFQIKQKTLK